MDNIDYVDWNSLHSIFLVYLQGPFDPKENQERF